VTILLLPGNRAETPPLPMETKSRSDSSVRERTQSMEEQLTQEDGAGGTNRSDILNRISKMGQSMLPGSTGPSSTSVASEDDVVRRNWFL